MLLSGSIDIGSAAAVGRNQAKATESLSLRLRIALEDGWEIEELAPRCVSLY